MTSKRDIAAANETGFNAKVVKPVIFARLDFSSGVQRFHTEIGPKTATHPVHGSESYTGLGDFGGINGDVVESTQGAEQKVSLELTGVKASLVNLAFTDDYFRRDADLMIGLEDETGALLANPELLFSGFMETMNIALSEGLGAIQLLIESRASNLRRASDKRFTDEDLQREQPGDLFAEYVYRMVDLELFWGDRQFSSPFGTTRVPGDYDPNRPGRYPTR